MLVASGNKKDFAGDVVEDHGAMRKLARVHCLGVIPWLRPCRQIRTEDVAGLLRNSFAYLRFVRELHPCDIRFGFL